MIPGIHNINPAEKIIETPANISGSSNTFPLNVSKAHSLHFELLVSHLILPLPIEDFRLYVIIAQIDHKYVVVERALFCPIFIYRE